MKVTVIESRPKSLWWKWFALAIMMFEKTNYSHYALRIGHTIVHVTGKGIEEESLEDFDSHYRTMEEYWMPVDIQTEQLTEWARKYSDRKYGIWQVIGLALKRLGITKNNVFKNARENLICSELVLMFMQDFMSIKTPSMDELGLRATHEIVSQHEKYLITRLGRKNEENN